MHSAPSDCCEASRDTRLLSVDTLVLLTMSRFRLPAGRSVVLACLACSLMAGACDRRQERVDRLQSIAQGVGDQVSGQDKADEETDDDNSH